MASGDGLVVEVFTPGREITGRCTATVRGGRFVVPSADITGGFAGTENPRIAEAGASAAAIGVSRYEGILNEEIPLISNNGSYVPMPAGAALVAGNPVASDAQGRPIPWVTPAHKLGVAVTTQAVVDSPVLIKLNGI